jgi:hypothetical protein
MTQTSKEQSTAQSAATSAQQSTRQGSVSASENIPLGRAPISAPPRVTDYDELDKKTVDTLVDSLKYIATSSGIVIAMYSQALRDYVKLPVIATRPLAQMFVFAPLLLWFFAILGTVVGIFPREYNAVTEAEKERAMRDLRKRKTFWVKLVLLPFMLGFALFLYVIAAQIWLLFPFR